MLGGGLMVQFFFILILGVLSFIDWKTHRIPDLGNVILYLLGGVPLFFALSWEKLLGAGILFSFFFLLYLLRPEGVGFGDVKLSGAIGLFLGWRLGVLALFLAFLGGALLGVALILKKKKTLKDPLPFAPFLSGGAVVALLWGEKIIAWYLGLFLLATS